MASDIVVPSLGESIREAVVTRWLKQVGEAVKADEPLAELETDKVTVELRAPEAGVLAERRVAEGATVKIGDVVGRVEGAGTATATPAPTTTPTPLTTATLPLPLPSPLTTTRTPSSTSSGLTERPLTPAQRKALREGVAAAAPVVAAGPPVVAAAPIAVAPVATPRAAGGERVVPMSPLRRKIAERLVAAQHATASLTTFNEVDMSHVIALRDRYKDAFLEAHAVKLGFMSFFAKAALATLREFPGLNAELRGEAIVYKERYDLGIAVGGGKGLVVPVIRDADRLSFAALEAAIASYGKKAKESKLTVDEMSGGTFTITNGGVFGSMLSTPLLNFPQTGILGMHNIVRRPVAVGDAVEIRPVMYVALTYDHRVVDGREAVQFLVGIKTRIESPERLMFEL